MFQCVQMSRYDYLASDSSLRTTLDGRNVDELKKLVALVPGVSMKAPRKGDLVAALERFLLGDGAVRLWTQLKALEQSAVAEAVHSDDGTFDADAFHANTFDSPRSARLFLARRIITNRASKNSPLPDRAAQSDDPDRPGRAVTRPEVAT